MSCYTALPERCCCLLAAQAYIVSLLKSYGDALEAQRAEEVRGIGAAGHQAIDVSLIIVLYGEGSPECTMLGWPVLCIQG